MSSIIKKISKTKKKKILLFTNKSEIFLNNPRIFMLFKLKRGNFFWYFLYNLKGKSILEFNSKHATKENHENKKKYFLYFHQNNRIHLAQAMSEHFNLNLDYSYLENEFYFSSLELENYKKNIILPEKYALIQSTSKLTFTKNKEWKVDGMQSIINNFKKIKWIQIGKDDEPILNNCEKMLNLNLREVAYVISKCEFLITYEGLFNHLASCFKKKNFLIHTGFLPSEAFKYKNNVIIEKNSNMNCYPCYDIECKDHNNNCLENLSTKYVLDKIEQNL
jgi:ADP-heptose:LPS heptosyltransferase